MYKRNYYLIPFLCLFSCIFSCNISKTNNVEIDYGYSTIFSEKEIKLAVDTVLKEFRGFEGCELKKLWYDETVLNSEIEDYLTYGNGSINGTKRNNIIILLSAFYVDDTGGDGSFSPNSMYEDWIWILIRESETAKWKVDDWGY